MPNDITPGITFTTNQQNINAPQMNAIAGSAVINPSFVSGKPSSAGMAANDTLLMYSQSGGNLQQVSYANIASQVLGTAQNGIANVIHNGDMSVNQWAMASAVGVQVQALFTTVDRWKFSRASGATLRPTITQGNVGGIGQILSPNPPFYYYLKVVPQTTQGSLAAGDFALIRQGIENQYVLPLMGEPMSLSFVYNTNAAGTYYIFFQDSAAGFSYVIPLTAAGDSAWHLAQFPNITAPTSSGNWGFGTYGSLGMIFGICLGAGTTFQTSTFNAWQAGNFYCGSNQLNFFNTSSDYFEISQVCLNSGSSCAPFPSISFQSNLAQCQRYYTQSYQYGVSPGANTAAGSIDMYPRTTAIAAVFGGGFPVSMRTAPTVAFFAPGGASDSNFSAGVLSDTRISEINNSSNNFTVATVVSAQFIAQADF